MIDIAAAEQAILTVLPDVTALKGEINTMGSYLVFQRMVINNAHIADVDYEFRLFIAISSKTKNKRLVYAPLSTALGSLLSDYEINRKIEIGTIAPYAIKGLIVYQIPLIVKGITTTDYVEI